MIAAIVLVFFGIVAVSMGKARYVALGCLLLAIAGLTFAGVLP